MEKISRIAVNDFDYFVKYIFSKSFDEFIYGDYISEVCDFVQYNNFTIEVSARNHFKSLKLYAHVMWTLLKMKYENKAIESHYFSYKAEMASYHIGNTKNKDNIKALIERNPYFFDIIDNKPQSEALIDLSWRHQFNERNKPTVRYTLTPHGMLTAIRGLHCNGPVYIDDALQDPSEKLDPKIIYRVNDVFFTQILDIPIGSNKEIHVVGTAQTDEDFYFDERVKQKFAVAIRPGLRNIETDEYGWIINGTPIWKEWLSLSEHKAKQRDLGIKVYAQEYLATPLYSAETFFQKWQLEAIAIDNQHTKREAQTDEDILAGWDLGKHAHPAHFVVVVKKDGKRTPIHDHWFDGVDYTKQLEYIDEMVESLDIDRVFYDNTRGELEALDEQGELSAEYVPINFSRKVKHSLATQFEKGVTTKKQSIMNNQRTIKQICVVDNDLNARETKDGHGDSFWSYALTYADDLEAEVSFYVAS